MNYDSLIFLWNTLNGNTHQDYAHTVSYAKKLKNLCSISPDANGELLSQFVKRESEEDFKQRKILTRLTSASLINRIATPFNKALRSDNANISIETDELKELANKFIGNTSLYTWITTEVHKIAFYDPNAFLVITIPDFNYNVEQAKHKPVIVRSKNVLNFHYEDHQLIRAVLVMGAMTKCYSYSDDPAKSECIIAVEVEETAAAIDPQAIKDNPTQVKLMVKEATAENPMYVKAANKYYKIYPTSPTIKGIQVMRIGYIPDIDTDGRTCVVPYHVAITRIESMVKAKSELDMSVAMHVFAQKIQQVEMCKGFKGEDGLVIQCNNGYQQGNMNAVCKNCNGSGHEPISKSAMDVITVAMGKKGDDMKDLDNIVRYIQTDVQTPKFLHEYITTLEQACVQDVFPNNRNEKSVMASATEIKVDYEDQQDVLLPYNRQIEALWLFCMDIATQIKEVKNPVYNIRFPDDLDIKTLSDLLIDYKASDGMPVAVRKLLRKKISRKLSASDSASEKREAVRIMHEPFGEKKTDDIKYLISQNLVTIEQKVLWANYDTIMDELERLFKNWFEMPMDLRQKEIDKKVAEIIAKLTPAQAI